MLLRRGGVVAVCCCLLQLCGNADASLAKLVCPQADACKWSTFASSAGRSLSLRAQELARAPNHQYAELAHQHTRKKDKTDAYSGFGGALAYGYGFRITRSAFGIVAVFGGQNSFCHLGVP